MVVLLIQMQIELDEKKKFAVDRLIKKLLLA